jgi:hypothetical protein
MMGRSTSRDLTALAGIVAIGPSYAIGVIERQARGGFAIPSHDTYAQYVPNILYALDRLAEGGSGLLWNRLQNCGQPFFANAAHGLLYPMNAVLLWTDIPSALLVLFAVHLSIGGAGIFALCRQHRIDRAAALCGAITFQLGAMTIFLGVWLPTVLASYCWLPAALACGEWVLERPSLNRALLLGAILTIQFLAGHPQVTVFTYQLLLLRLASKLLTGGPGGRATRLFASVASLLLPVALGAVQLLPSLEFVSESLRSRPLTPKEIWPPGGLSIGWTEFRALAATRIGYGGIFSPLPLALAGFGLLSIRTRGLALFYLAVAGLYFALAFDNPLFDLYRRLPLGSQFRMPNRFLWVTAFASAILAALGAAALTRGDLARALPRWGLALPLGAGGALYLLSGQRPPAWEWGLLALATTVAAVATRGEPGARAARAFLPVLLVAGLLPLVTRPFFGYPGDLEILFAHRELFRSVASRMTPQDRVYQSGAPGDFSLTKKSSSLFGVPSVVDYETQTSARYAELLVRMNLDRPMRSINDFYYGLVPVPRNAPLLNLVAARYVIADTTQRSFPRRLPPAFREIGRQNGLRVYENTAALPRAFYVPRIEVIRDLALLLEKLADPAHDPLAAALVEEPLPSLGPGAGSGSVRILADRSEEVRLSVDATRPGFLFLSDQHYPGWQASVNGSRVPTVRANHAFRLVPVPAGTSSVVFRYVPGSFVSGLLCSLASFGLLAGLLAWRAIGRHRRSADLGLVAPPAQRP